MRVMNKESDGLWIGKGVQDGNLIDKRKSQYSMNERG